MGDKCATSAYFHNLNDIHNYYLEDIGRVLYLLENKCFE